MRSHGITGAVMCQLHRSPSLVARFMEEISTDHAYKSFDKRAYAGHVMRPADGPALECGEDVGQKTGLDVWHGLHKLSTHVSFWHISLSLPVTARRMAVKQDRRLLMHACVSHVSRSSDLLALSMHGQS
jgi:hypothetical protein